MKQEEKQLLIKDISARVFYGVKVNIERDFPNNPQIVERIAKDGEIIINGILAYDIYYYKPYLRPMSSMTEDEKKELLNITTGEDGQKYFTVTSKGIQSTDELIQYGYDWEYHWLDFSNENITTYSDWLNEHHFDYRGLIEKGLALEAPEDMYKTE